MNLEWASQIGIEHREQILQVFLSLSLGHLAHLFLGFLTWVCIGAIGFGTNASILERVSLCNLW